MARRSPRLSGPGALLCRDWAGHKLWSECGRKMLGHSESGASHMRVHTHTHTLRLLHTPLCITHILADWDPPSLPSGSMPPMRSSSVERPLHPEKGGRDHMPLGEAGMQAAADMKHVRPPCLVLRNGVLLTSFNTIYIKDGPHKQVSALHEGPLARSRSCSVRHHRLPPTCARTEILPSGATGAHYSVSVHRQM